MRIWSGGCQDTRRGGLNESGRPAMKRSGPRKKTQDRSLGNFFESPLISFLRQANCIVGLALTPGAPGRKPGAPPLLTHPCSVLQFCTAYPQAGQNGSRSDRESYLRRIRGCLNTHITQDIKKPARGSQGGLEVCRLGARRRCGQRRSVFV